MIKVAEIFPSLPGRLTQAPELSVAGIFNNITRPRLQEVEDIEPVYDPKAEYTEPERRTAPNYREPVDRRAHRAFMPVSPTASYEEPPQQVSAMSPSSDFDPADFTFNSEARRDHEGRLKAYRPPEGDGGGSFEVAGITQRYQPEESAKLREMLDSGDFAGAENYAKEFYRKRAEPFLRFTDNPGLQLQITDSVHHRGEGGLRRILQRATGLDSRDYGTLIRELSDSRDPLSAFDSARRNYEWDEVERGRESRKKFHKGLENRFNAASEAARKLS